MKKSKKIRIDQLLKKKYPQYDLNRLRALIMAGRVYAGGKIIDKAGTLVDVNTKAEIKEAACPFVSRGGLKLEGALKDFNVPVKDKIILDVGASTGGFTDCLLRRGASHVIALDTGYGQLDYKLRHHERVTVMERFNVRHLTYDHLKLKPQLAVIDVSFISLALVFPVMAALKIEEIICLVKPQFELEKRHVDEGAGVVRAPKLHEQALQKAIKDAKEQGYGLAALSYSKLVGPKGNIEFFLHLVKKPGLGLGISKEEQELIENIVKEAHLKLGAD